MGNNSEGAKKIAQKLKEKDPDHFKKIGANGGKKSKGGGFASMDKSKHLEASSKGGKIRAENAKGDHSQDI